MSLFSETQGFVCPEVLEDETMRGRFQNEISR
jgi:hypothetical protein